MKKLLSFFVLALATIVGAQTVGARIYNPPTSTFADIVTASSFAANSPIATSTFAGGISIGTSTPALAKLTIYDGSGSLGSAYGMIRTISTDSNGGNYDIRMDSPNPDIEFIETDQTSPAGKYEIAGQGDIFQVNGRSLADNTFENFVEFRRPAAIPNYLMSIVASSTSSTQDALRIRNSVSSSGAYPGISWFTDTNNFKTARLSSSQGSGGANSDFIIEVADASKILRPRLNIIASGNIGIASSTPWRTFSVGGTVAFSGLTSSITGNGVCISTSKDITDAGAAACIPSALRFKEKVETLKDSASSILNKLRVVTFNYKKGVREEHPNEEKERVGMIAEEVKAVDNRLVAYDKDGQVLTLNFEEITALSVKAIQEQQVLIEKLEKRIEALENK